VTVYHLSINYGPNLTFLVVTSAAMGNPSWILSFSISPCPSSAQYRINRSHAGCTQMLAESGVRRGNDGPKFALAPSAISIS
jgi:hypothetical protein